ncbi:hypothetical protein [Methyloversatilis sp.]|uniref:hypothetical protein n=1 Tax=Methyloversatilis sp. TaxID=2569862 RepID=UPI0035B311B2
MKAHVFHAKKMGYRDIHDGMLITKPEFDFMYELVATVQMTDDDVAEGVNHMLEVAFEATNSVGVLWCKYDLFKFDFRVERARSTSVGDIVVLELEKGRENFVVASVGWYSFRM